MKVTKFGGTSMATAEQIRKVCDIILSDSERRLVVVSAPGKRFKEDTKVTDLLINLAEKYLSVEAAEDELQAVVERYREIARDLGLKEEIVDVIDKDLRERLKVSTNSKEKFIDCMKAAGEDNSAKITAEYLRSKGLEAHYINPGDAGLLLSNEFGNARVLPVSYENLKALKKKTGIMIFPGFFGYSPNGDVVTFSRGGSDITGSILAAAVEASVYENFTDVDSVFVANPHIVKNPIGISEITYREMRELSYAGFTVLHEETLEPVYRKGIPVNIRNTNNPSVPGTFIVTGRERTDRPVIGIAGDKGFCSVYIRKYLMNREIGFGRKVLQILEEEGLSYEHVPSGIDELSIILREKQLNEEMGLRIVTRIKEELNAEEVSIVSNLALVVVVGEGMIRTVGLAVRATGALAKANVNIEMINQGSSEVSIMFGVVTEDKDKAVRALYEEFFPK